MMLSSADLPGDAARCRQLGVAAYLAKPIKQSELLNTILRVLGAPAVEAEQAASADEQLIGKAVRPLRVLVVEDNLVNQKVAVRLLEHGGHTVLLATNGREAVDVVARYEFDVVLMDVQMPEMDGFEATAAIRERERTNGAHLPIIAMTADAMKGDAERCLAAGMDAYIAKPIHSSTLFNVIGRVVAEHTAVHPDSDETAPAPASTQAQ
jgi:CheY-like chemotaxis protein